MNNKIAIGMINYGNIRAEVSSSLAEIFQNDNFNKKLVSGLIQNQGPYIDDNRNKVVEIFLHSNSEWLLFIDTDVEVTLDHIYTLYDIATFNNLYILGGIYFYGESHHSLNIRPMIMQKDKNNISSISYDIPLDKNYFEVDTVGTGSMIIHRSVFEKINNFGPDNKNYWFRTYDENIGFIGEDVYFCNLAKKFGYKVYATSKVMPNHYKTVIFNYEIFAKQRNL